VRTRLRTLHLDGRSWAWVARIGRVSDVDGQHRWIRLRIWGAGKNSQALQVDLVSTRARGNEWRDAADDDSAYPTSQDVRTVIEYAVGRGWEPDATGATYPLTDTALELPGFRVVDLGGPAGPGPGTDRRRSAAQEHGAAEDEADRHHDRSPGAEPASGLVSRYRTS
jgi:hypothetical protein